MVKDISTEIINESIRRFVDQSTKEVGNVELRLPDCPFFGQIGPEQMKRMAALSIAMIRIVESASWN